MRHARAAVAWRIHNFAFYISELNGMMPGRHADKPGCHSYAKKAYHHTSTGEKKGFSLPTQHGMFRFMPAQ
jgi:hypothetical protein